MFTCIFRKHGCYAQYTVTPASTTFPIPDSVSFEEASTIPLAAMTAAIALFINLGFPEQPTGIFLWDSHMFFYSDSFFPSRTSTRYNYKRSGYLRRSICYPVSEACGSICNWCGWFIKRLCERTRSRCCC